MNEAISGWTRDLLHRSRKGRKKKPPQARNTCWRSSVVVSIAKKKFPPRNWPASSSETRLSGVERIRTQCYEASGKSARPCCSIRYTTHRTEILLGVFRGAPRRPRSTTTAPSVGYGPNSMWQVYVFCYFPGFVMFFYPLDPRQSVDYVRVRPRLD